MEFTPFANYEIFMQERAMQPSTFVKHTHIYIYHLQRRQNFIKFIGGIIDQKLIDGEQLRLLCIYDQENVNIFETKYTDIIRLSKIRINEKRPQINHHTQIQAIYQWLEQAPTSRASGGHDETTSQALNSENPQLKGNTRSYLYSKNNFLWFIFKLELPPSSEAYA